MKYYQIVFSPTGGTERVAKAITQNWPQVGTIDLSAPDTKYAAGRPNADDCKELTEFGNRILEKATSNQLSKPSVPGNRPYKKIRNRNDSESQFQLHLLWFVRTEMSRRRYLCKHTKID